MSILLKISIWLTEFLNSWIPGKHEPEKLNWKQTTSQWVTLILNIWNCSLVCRCGLVGLGKVSLAPRWNLLSETGYPQKLSLWEITAEHRCSILGCLDGYCGWWCDLCWRAGQPCAWCWRGNGAAPVWRVKCLLLVALLALFTHWLTPRKDFCTICSMQYMLAQKPTRLL